MCLYMHVYVSTYAYIHIYTHIHIHTHILCVCIYLKAGVQERSSEIKAWKERKILDAPRLQNVPK